MEILVTKKILGGAVPQDLDDTDPCPIAPVVELVFGRWTSHVLWTLANHGRMRFGELREHIPAVTPKVLTQRLRQLERDGFISRAYHPEMPPRVEYECTSLAISLRPIFTRIVEWSDAHLDDVREARRQFDGGVAADRA